STGDNPRPKNFQEISKCHCPSDAALSRKPKVLRLDLRRKPEMHHVAVGDLVLLAFQPQLADVARVGLAAALDVILMRARLGAEEAALEIGVDPRPAARKACYTQS